MLLFVTNFDYFGACSVNIFFSKSKLEINEKLSKSHRVNTKKCQIELTMSIGLGKSTLKAT